MYFLRLIYYSKGLISKDQCVGFLSGLERTSLLLLFSFFLLIIFQPATSQQLPLFSQYTFDAFLLNPAAAGSEGYTALNFTTRAQWVGVDGAPETGNFTYQTRIMKRDYIMSNAPVLKNINTRKIQEGLDRLRDILDHAGLIDQTCAFITYAYHIARPKDQFSMGITFSLLQYKVDLSQLTPAGSMPNFQ